MLHCGGILPFANTLPSNRRYSTKIAFVTGAATMRVIDGILLLVLFVVLLALWWTLHALP